ncbi:acyl-CoA dehydrogenase family protein [Blastococcus capsensis]|uniref:acyl-CoA dehydrogenase family protein n=1 Tax=Blastococcus capsensis TaxID=1564163 RepID=UPI0025411F38|nr:acyl-CoA dehydrogenase family protein [Blastococcus capsensis]MDK3258480.1 acyl-CoA dehydrogenase family protein [Blastococcus capsensis]
MNDERRMLVDAATSIFEDLCSPETVRAAEQSGWPGPLWSALAEAGFPWVSVPEQHGGSGGSVADACALLRVAGAFAAPVPLAETGLLAGWALSSAGLELPSGPATVGVGNRDDTLGLTGSPGSWRLSGQLHRVPWARESERIVAIAQQHGQAYVVSVKPDDTRIEPGRNLAGEPRDTVRLDGVATSDDAVAPAPDGVSTDALVLRGALARAALMSGALSRVSAITIRYTNERQQFGRPIARFQAVQQHLVKIAEQTEAAIMAVTAAAGNAVRACDFFDVAAAKIVAGEAANIASASSHQAHGAIGMTKEYELGQLSRRLWSWRDEFGRAEDWSRLLGRQVAEAGSDALWPRISTGLFSNA